MWERAFDLMLRRLLQKGGLQVTLPNGQRHHYGDGSGVPLYVELHNMATVRHLVLNPELGLGEAYMNGTLTITEGDLHSFLGLIVKNYRNAPGIWWQRLLPRLRIALRRFTQNNVALRSRRNVAHHYDLSDTLYDLFLTFGNLESVVVLQLYIQQKKLDFVTPQGGEYVGLRLGFQNREPIFFQTAPQKQSDFWVVIDDQNFLRNHTLRTNHLEPVNLVKRKKRSNVSSAEAGAQPRRKTLQPHNRSGCL